jgi:virulence-associated protein VapD
VFVNTGTYYYGILYVNVLCYRKIFDDCRDNLASYFKDREPVLWTFHPKIVFERFQAFLKRLETIKVLKFEENSNFMYHIISFIYLP